MSHRQKGSYLGHKDGRHRAFRNGFGREASWLRSEAQQGGNRDAVAHEPQAKASVGVVVAQKQEEAAEVTTLGPTGFDLSQGAVSNVSAVPVRRKQPANVICERQRGTRSRPRGVNGVGAQGTRVTRLRDHTSVALDLRRSEAEKLTVVEAPTPWRQGPLAAQKRATHASERLICSGEDSGSIPDGSTPSSHTAATKSRAQQQAIAGRPASVSDGLTGRAAAQPELLPT